jgi:hypothetical protein
MSQRLTAAMVAAAAVVLALLAPAAAAGAAVNDVPTSAPTFTKDVLPILQKNCQD